MSDMEHRMEAAHGCPDSYELPSFADLRQEACSTARMLGYALIAVGFGCIAGTVLFPISLLG